MHSKASGGLRHRGAGDQEADVDHGRRNTRSARVPQGRFLWWMRACTLSVLLVAPLGLLTFHVLYRRDKPDTVTQPLGIVKATVAPMEGSGHSARVSSVGSDSTSKIGTIPPDGGGSIRAQEDLDQKARDEFSPALDLESVSNIVREVFAQKISHDNPQSASASIDLSSPRQMQFGGKITATSGRRSGSIDIGDDPRGALAPEGIRKIGKLLHLGSDDRLLAIGDGRTLLSLALASRPQLAVSITSDAQVHRMQVEAIRGIVGRSIFGGDQVKKYQQNTFQAVLLGSGSDGLSLAELARGTTAAFLFGPKLKGIQLFELVRTLADALPPGAAVVTQDRWQHCHAGFIGPVADASVEFARLPKGGRVFVYLVAPRLSFSLGTTPPRLHFEADPKELEATVVGLPAREHAGLVTPAELKAWLLPRWVQAAGSASDASGVSDVRAERVALRIRRLVSSSGSAVSAVAWASLQPWLLGRLTGSATTPLECLFKDVFALVAGSERAAVKINSSELEMLGDRRASYSEIMPASVKHLLKELPLEDGEYFTDLGSGVGKVAFQVALTLPVRVRGFEISPTRHRHALAAWEMLRDDAKVKDLGSLDGSASGDLRPKGSVELIQQDFANPPRVGDSIADLPWLDSSVVLLHTLVCNQTAAASFEAAHILPRHSAPGTVLLSLAKLQGCHRGLRLVTKLKVRVDWSSIPVPAYVYIVAPRPPKAVSAAELPSAKLALTGEARLRDFRCLERAAMAVDVDGRIDRMLAGSSDKSGDASMKQHRLDWITSLNYSLPQLQVGWLRGDHRSTWDCLFVDLEALAELEPGKVHGAGLQSYWRDSTSVNADADLQNLQWSELGGPRTYGEILPSSVASLVAALSLGTEDVFYDLGSGAGKVVLQVHLQTSVRRAAGIELEESRDRAARLLLRQARALGVVDIARDVSFILGDATNGSLWADATVIFMLCTCFPREVLLQVARLALARPLGTRLVAASFPLPRLPPDSGQGRVLRLTKHVTLPTSFSMGEPFFFYEVADTTVATAPGGGTSEDEAAVAAAATAAEVAAAHLEERTGS